MIHIMFGSINEGTDRHLQMNRLSFEKERNNRLNFKTLGRFSIDLRGIYGIYLELMQNNRKMVTTCNQLDLRTQGFLIDYV